MAGFVKRFESISGAQAEEEVFGEAKNHIEFNWWLEHKKEFRMPEEQAMNLIKENQPSPDPTEPGPKFAYDLHATVAEQITPEDYQNLRFYTAVHTFVDYGFGYDAFFEFDSENGTIRITIDASKEQKEKYEADILIVYPESLDPQDKEDKKKWFEIINKAAEEITAVIKQKIAAKQREEKNAA